MWGDDVPGRDTRSRVGQLNREEGTALQGQEQFEGINDFKFQDVSMMPCPPIYGMGISKGIYGPPRGHDVAPSVRTPHNSCKCPISQLRVAQSVQRELPVKLPAVSLNAMSSECRLI